MSKTNSKPVDCFNCKYFYTTWDVNNPRGCTAFGFKTIRLPSLVVLETSGDPCHKFQSKAKPPPKKKKKNGGWIA